MAEPSSNSLHSPLSLVNSTNGSHFNKVSSAFGRLCNISDEAAQQITSKIFEEQKKLSGSQVLVFKASETVPYELHVLVDKIVILMKKIGEGTSTEVYKTEVIPTTRHNIENYHFSPGKPQEKALKITKRKLGKNLSFSPEKRALDLATGGKTKGIDHFIQTYKDDGIGYAINDLFDSDLSHADFHVFSRPAYAIVTVLIDIATGIENLHLTQHVHRDLKGGNMLVSLPPVEDKKTLEKETAEVKGCVTDFGTLMRQQKKRHSTAATVLYLDASLFGSEEETLLFQKFRKGTQTREGDIFSFGMAIYRDVLVKLIQQLCAGDPKNEASIEALRLLDKLKVKMRKGPFTNEQLQALGKGSNYRRVYNESQQGECIYEYPQIEEIRNNIKGAFQLLSNKLHEKDLEVFQLLTDLMCDMQVVDRSIRPTIQKVLIELQKFKNTVKIVPIAFSLGGSPDVNDEPATKKSRSNTEILSLNQEIQDVLSKPASAEPEVDSIRTVKDPE